MSELVCVCVFALLSVSKGAEVRGLLKLILSYHVLDQFFYIP